LIKIQPSARRRPKQQGLACSPGRPTKLLVAFALLLLVLAGLLGSALLPAASRACLLHSPKVTSHRGFDASDVSIKVTSAETIRSLVAAGVRSFDLDLFWTADPEVGFFIGHPPSVLSLWRLAGPLSQTPLATLRAGGPALLAFDALLGLIRELEPSLDEVSLELKEPEHPLWAAQLRRLYKQIGASGIDPHKLAAVVASPALAAEHRRQQEAAGVRLPLLGLVRDLDLGPAPNGLSASNLSALLDKTDAASGAPYDGWTISARLLDGQQLPQHKGRLLSVWTVDDEDSLRRSWHAAVDAVITNHPLWAQRLLSVWVEERCRVEGVDRQAVVRWRS